MLKPRLVLLFLLIFSSDVFANNADPIQLFDDGELEQAQQKFEERLQQDSNDSTALLYLARIAQQNGDLDKAEELIEEALEKAPENAAIQYRYGGILGEVAGEASIFTALGYAKKSLKGLERAAEIEPDNIEYQRGLLNYYLIAPGIAGGDNEQALKQAKSIQLLDEKAGVLAFSSVYRSMGDEDKLAQLFDSAIRQFPEDADLYQERGLSNQIQEKFSAAFADFHQAKVLAEKQPEAELEKYDAIYQLARTSVLSEQRVLKGIEAMLIFIEQAPEIQELPSKEWASFRLANLYELNEQKKEAKSIYRKLYKTTKDSDLKKRVKRKR